MKVARATPPDLGDLVEMARAFHAESPSHRQLTFSEQKVVDLVLAAMESPDWLVLCARHDTGQLVGCAMVYVLPAYFSDDRELADLAFYVSPDSRGGRAAAAMLEEIATFGRTRGAKRVTIGINTGINHDKALQFFTRCGFPLRGYLVGQ